MPLVILKDSSMTLEVDTREKELDTGSHSLQDRDTLCRVMEDYKYDYTVTYGKNHFEIVEGNIGKITSSAV